MLRGMALIGRRLLALTALGAAAFGVYLALLPVVGPRAPGPGAVAAATVVRLQRPRAVPAQVPPWAWKLEEWLRQGGKRPRAAPAHVPGWFWAWRRWRTAAAR